MLGWCRAMYTHNASRRYWTADPFAGRARSISPHGRSLHRSVHWAVG